MEQNEPRVITHPLRSSTTSERVEFLKQTYMHLAIAILSFVVIEYLLFQTELPFKFTAFLYRTGSIAWIGVILLFGFASNALTNLSLRTTEKSQQYFALFGIVLLEAIIFMPLLLMAIMQTNGTDVLYQAALMTLGIFGGLTFYVLTTKKDFSFLGGILKVGFIVAICLIIAGAIFGFHLGLLFSFLMAALACGSILYTTSSILKGDYSKEQYVGASTMLFASVMLLFWYILQIFMRSE